MTHRIKISAEQLHDAYTEIHESFEGARSSLDELQTEITDELSDFTSSLDEIRDELERCNHMLRKLSRRMNHVMSCMAENEVIASESPW